MNSKPSPSHHFDFGQLLPNSLPSHSFALSQEKTMQGGGGAPPPGQVVVQMTEPKLADAGDSAKSPDVLDHSSSPLPSFKAGGGDRRPPATPAAAKPRSILRSPTIAVKPKSRFVELNYPPPPKSVAFDDAAGAAVTTGSASKRISDDDDDDDDSDFDWDGWKKGDGEGAAEQEVEEKNRKRRSKVKWRAVAESAVFMVIAACLVSSLAVPSLKRAALWGLAPWKWCVLVLVVFSGRLVAEWLVVFLVVLIERNFMLRDKVFYFVYGLRRSVQNCVWLGLVVLAWSLLFRSAIETSSPGHRRLLSRVSRALLAVLIAAVIWLLKVLLVKLLASSFHVATFFDRMKESVFHHYILEALSGPPLDEAEAAHPPPPPEEEEKKGYYKRWKSAPERAVGGSRREVPSRRIDMEKLKQLSRSRATAWGVKRLVSHITRSGLSTMARTVDETVHDFNEASEMTSELEARITAQRVFHHVAGENKK